MTATVLTLPNPIIYKLEKHLRFSPHEMALILGLPVQIIEIERGQYLVREGDRPTQCFGIINGMACNFKGTSPGNRQIVAIHVPGDVPDLQSLHLTVIDFSMTALSLCRVAFIQHEALKRLCEQSPRIANVLWRETLVEASIGREWLVNLGQRLAYTRLSHLFCELFIRLEAMGLAEGRAFEFPMTQNDLADTTGMSLVHVNRCLKALRTEGLAQMRAGKLEILNWKGLTAAGDFDEAYMHRYEKIDAHG